MKSRFLFALALLLCFSGNLFSRETTIIDLVERGREDLQRETEGKYEFDFRCFGSVKGVGGRLYIDYTLDWPEDLSPVEAAKIGRELASILCNTVGSVENRESIFGTRNTLACFTLSILFPSSIGLDGKHERSQMDLNKTDFVRIRHGDLRVVVWDPETGYSKKVICEPLRLDQEEAPDEE